MSLRNISGTSFISVSRSIPPNAPVIVPMMIATQMGKPYSKLLAIPTTVNKPSPIASNMNIVLFNRITYFRKIATKTSANPVTTK